MKINGRSFTSPNSDVVVFPREGGDVVFNIVATLDDGPHSQIDPAPLPTKIVYADGREGRNTEDPEYLESLQQWSSRKMDWYVLQSIRTTDNLEWDQVKYDQPLTWQNWREELRKAFFSENEITHLTNRVIEINSLNQAILDEARNRFLRKKAAQAA